MCLEKLTRQEDSTSSSSNFCFLPPSLPPSVNSLPTAIQILPFHLPFLQSSPSNPAVNSLSLLSLSSSARLFPRSLSHTLLNSPFQLLTLLDSSHIYIPTAIFIFRFTFFCFIPILCFILLQQLIGPTYRPSPFFFFR